MNPDTKTVRSQYNRSSESKSEMSTWSVPSEIGTPRVRIQTNQPPGQLQLVVHSIHRRKLEPSLILEVLTSLSIVSLVVLFTLKRFEQINRLLDQCYRIGKYEFCPGNYLHIDSYAVSFNHRLAYVIINTCYPLLWLLLIEIYKEYLRISNEVVNNQNEIALSNQIQISNRIKLAERCHFRSLSQLLVLLLLQLVVAVNEDYSRELLPRVVIVGNTLFILTRCLEMALQKRMRIFTAILTYLPSLLGIGFCIIYHLIHPFKQTTSFHYNLTSVPKLIRF